MNMLVSFIILICHCNILFATPNEVTKEVQLENIIRTYGYPFEKYSVKTEDGYILKLHRIPNKSNENNFNEYDYISNDILNYNESKKVVLIMHGLLGSSADWVVTGPNRSLALMLADLGYDVWLGNNRGNTFSKQHVQLSTKDKQFWDFSWHELGIFDCPAMINYILEKTGQHKIYYVGFSQGTTQFYVMNSMLPWYNSKIQLMVGLAPVAFTGHLTGLLKPIARISPLIRPIINTVGNFEFSPSNPFLTALQTNLCKKDAITQPLCLLITFLIAGFGYEEVDKEHVDDYFAFAPAGCSSKQLLHYASGVNNPGHFRQYDYGRIKNLLKYGTSSPPEYPLKKVTAPIVHFKGLNDKLAVIEDIELLESILPNLVETHTVTLRRLNHFDFLYGINIRELVYSRIAKLFHLY